MREFEMDFFTLLETSMKSEGENSFDKLFGRVSGGSHSFWKRQIVGAKRSESKCRYMAMELTKTVY